MSRSGLLDQSGYFSTETIIAPASTLGGAIALVRLSGSKAIQIAEKITHLKLEPTQARRAIRAVLYEHRFNSEGRAFDDALVTPFFAPFSFTGEDCIEFAIHGSKLICDRLIEEAMRLGARPALRGEFSFRAVKNGKMTVTQAEAVHEMILADNDFSLQVALEKLSGAEHRLITEVKNEIFNLVTLSELGIDFSDQDIDEVSLKTLKKKMIPLKERLTRLSQSLKRGQTGQDGVPVCILGIPNAGKSALFNAILGQDRSIVTDLAGTTRDLVKEKLILESQEQRVPIRFVDTAGIRHLDDSKQNLVERVGMDLAKKAAKESELIIWAVSFDEMEKAREEFSLLRLDEGKTVGVLTKTDLLKNPDEEIKRVQSLFPEIKKWFKVSSFNLEGVDHLVQFIAERGAGVLKYEQGEVVLTRPEHQAAVDRALECLKRAYGASDDVLFSSELRYAMNALGPLIGLIETDDILGKIFSEFCIGK